MSKPMSISKTINVPDAFTSQESTATTFQTTRRPLPAKTLVSELHHQAKQRRRTPGSTLTWRSDRDVALRRCHPPHGRELQRALHRREGRRARRQEPPLQGLRLPKIFSHLEPPAWPGPPFKILHIRRPRGGSSNARLLNLLGHVISIRKAYLKELSDL